MQVQLDAEIIPNHGLGGLTLRTRLRDAQELITGWGMWGKVSYKLIAPYEARYRLAGGQMELAVDVRNGKIFKMSAYPGYTGMLFGHIAVGMRVADAMHLEPRLFYDEAEECIRCQGVAGLVLDVPEIDPPPALVPELVISAISVYAVEIDTLPGQEGDW